jgi:hypothetical protein
VEASLARESRRIVELSKSIHQAKKTIDACFDELDHLSRKYEAGKADFDKKLEDLG